MTITTKGSIIAILGLALMIIGSLTYGDNVLLAKVDLPGFAEYQDGLATYGYQECIKVMGDEQGKYSCNNFILTLNSENGGRNIKATNKNKNGTKDSGLCQLNSQYHSKFINSQEFQDPYKQIEYCLGVWQDSKKKGRMPRYGYAVRHKRDKGIRFINPPLSDKIAEPSKIAEPLQVKDAFKVQLKLTGRRCVLLARTKNDNSVIQVDTPAGRFFNWIFGVPKNAKIFECNK